MADGKTVAGCRTRDPTKSSDRRASGVSDGREHPGAAVPQLGGSLLPGSREVEPDADCHAGVAGAARHAIQFPVGSGDRDGALVSGFAWRDNRSHDRGAAEPDVAWYGRPRMVMTPGSTSTTTRLAPPTTLPTHLSLKQAKEVEASCP